MTSLEKTEELNRKILTRKVVVYIIRLVGNLTKIINCDKKIVEVLQLCEALKILRAGGSFIIIIEEKTPINNFDIGNTGWKKVLQQPFLRAQNASTSICPGSTSFEDKGDDETERSIFSKMYNVEIRTNLKPNGPLDAGKVVARKKSEPEQILANHELLTEDPIRLHFQTVERSKFLDETDPRFAGSKCHMETELVHPSTKPKYREVKDAH
ncbi:hypothetical protein Glove_309g101 [Diversispora epigaea]|uniref:Uncharacterized protein n=1 Tax=Diversispora epigaea TaxID=1348612 RepID=A0A397HZP7_9GLOM|nr:hypothetical protein Glove_309g101 [Diversispora epigaea]